jgi:SAM-dependent methyltransferase
MQLPYRTGTFDAAMSIAVLHHVSTEQRRRLLISETLRVLRPGGRALFYAWAAEQTHGRSGHVFEDSDVFVPFHSRVQPSKSCDVPGGKSRHASAALHDTHAVAVDADPDASMAPADSRGGVFDPEKKAIVFQRYCHVYREGELGVLLRSVGGLRILEEYYDTGNWCAVVEKE